MLAIFTVTNTNDSGAGSLREAMDDANIAANVGGIDEIHFSIGSGAQTIQPQSPLPTITDPVAILGNTQPGFIGVPLIELNGALQNSGVGLRIDSGGSEIRGLVINRFPSHGIVLEFGGDNKVFGNFVGMDSTGQVVLKNEGNGIIVFQSAGNEIGGATGEERNVISGNLLNGVTIVSSSGTKIKGNYIGLDVGGGLFRGNEGDGIAIFRSPGTMVGGDSPFEGNVISANGANGIVVFGTVSTGSVIQGNIIGLDSTGMVSRGNTRAGVVVTHEVGLPETEASETLIGGFTPGAGNVISGNGRSGIELFRTHDNTIRGNLIGLTSDGLGVQANGTAQVASVSHGIDLFDSFNNTIGGDDDDDGMLDGVVMARNFISGNIESGISITGALSSGNVVLGNYIGTDINGLGASSTFGNGLSGVHIDTASNNTIGGIAGAGNLISNNAGDGILIEGAEASGNRIVANYIGVNQAGNAAAGNGGRGVAIIDAPDNIVEGANVISSNASAGVVISGEMATGNKIAGNLIGVAANGEDPLGNLLEGVFVGQDASSNIIGDPVGDAGNVIAFNGANLGLQGHGVVIESGVFNQIRKNNIYSNSGRGIDLGNDSFTINDYFDFDDGANSLQNFPVVTQVEDLGSFKSITWSLFGVIEGEEFTLDFFANDSLDPSGFGEGKTYLSSITVTATEADFDNGRLSVPILFDSSDQFISATATDVFDNTSEFSMVDTDGDALADAWELTGIDVNEDGIIDLILNSDPNHKDIFVEVDAMDGRAPDPGTLADVITAFAIVPNNLVQNPDGEDGITLRAVLDETDVPKNPFSNGMEDAQFVKSIRFGTLAERMDANATNILQAKRLAYRWSIFADTGRTYEETGRQALGEGNLPGNDFYVALGPMPTMGGTRNQQAGVFMHELGHTLGLSHDGGSDSFTNYKPNYHSVMNYTWTIPGLLNTGGRPITDAEQDYFDSWELDYSREAFPNLDQTKLNESAGIEGHPGHSLRIYTTGLYVNENGPIDWDGNGIESGTVSMQLTNTTTPVITGYADWPNLQYYFLEASDLAEDSTGSLTEELTVELWQSFVDWRALPGDYNLSGTVGAADLTVWQDTFGQAAISPFANADGSGNSLVDGTDFLLWQRNFGSDINDPGQLQFLQPSYVVSETAGVFNVTVERIGGMQGAITVDFELEDGTALSTLDYVDDSGTLLFADGQTSQTISIQINDDELEEGDEYFNVTLSNPTGGASLGNPSTTAFTVSDNEGPIVVTNTNDTGGGSLRQAIQIANGRAGADTITFNVGIFATPQTILLSSGEIEITEAVTINGPGQDLLTIDAQQLSRVINFSAAMGDLTLSGLTLTGGLTTGDGASFGGGAVRSLTTGSLTLGQSTISGNSTTGGSAYGGGIFAYSGAVMLTSSTVSGNSTTGSNAYGGGIFVRSGAVTLTSSTVSGNSTTGSSAYGGGIWTYFGDVTLTSSTVSGNDSTDAGGGIWTYSGDVTLTSSTVSGNDTTDSGGGIYTRAGNVMLSSSTVTGNSAAGAGGGIYVFNTTLNPALTIENSIVAGNTASLMDPDLRPDPNSTLTINHSLIGVADNLGTITGNVGNQTGTAATPLDPMLGPLAGNGGPTETHALLVGSLAINAGDSAIVSPPPFDQRGAPFVRVFGGQIDIGAYERQTLAPSFFIVTTTTDELDYSNADVSLREAISSANSSVGADTITFDGALSGQTITLGGTELVITEDLSIDATALADNVTIDANELSRIFNITTPFGTFVAVTLAGLTLTGGQTIGDSNLNGGTALFGGGAVRFTRGSLTIDQSTISGNSTTGDGSNGGAIHTLFGELTLINSTLSGNSTAGRYARGGGISAQLGAVTLTNSTVSGNSTAGYGAVGGGIFTYSGAVTLTSSTISGNSTVGDNANGGGIYASGGELTLTNSTVSGNSTTGPYASGGGIMKNNGELRLTSSTVSGNSTTGYRGKGGGINAGVADVTITSSTVSGNSTAGDDADGGGIWSNGTVTLTSITVTDNRADGSNATGGGIWNNNDPITIANSIVAGNTAGGGSPDIDPGTGTLTVNFSLIGSAVTLGAGSGNNQVDDDPGLAALADNGGPTETHALLAGSPAIDAGDPSIAFNVSVFDQRGVGYARVENGRIDIGAYELQVIVVSADFNDDLVVDGFDFLAWQRSNGTSPASKSDGDADNDTDVDGDDLGIWQSQFGQPAPAVAASSSPVIASSLAAEPSTAFQVEVTTALTTTPEESVASRFPDNFIVSPSDLGLGFRFTAPRQVLVRAEHPSAEHPSAEHLDEAFRSDWHSWPEQNLEIASDDFVRTTHGRSAKATQPADKAFAELADDIGFARLRSSL